MNEITSHGFVTLTSGLGEYRGRDYDRTPLADFIARCRNAEAVRGPGGRCPVKTARHRALRRPGLRFGLAAVFSLAAGHAAMAQGAQAVRRIDVSSVEERFTGGDEFLASRFAAWFKQPIARAAYRIATCEPPENTR